MPAILSRTIKNVVAESFLDLVYDGKTNVYIVIGKDTEWEDERTPVTPIPTIEFENDFRNNIVAGVRIVGRSCSLVVPSVTIEQGKEFNPLPTDVENPWDTTGWYGYNPVAGYMYECLKKGDGTVIQIPSEKKSKIDDSDGHSDGYQWRFLYDVDVPTLSSGLMLENWIPVPYGRLVDGEIQYGTITPNQLMYGDVYASLYLHAHHVLLNVILSDDENDLLPEDISFRQVGILVNPTTGGLTNERIPVAGDIVLPGADFDRDSGALIYFENRVAVNRVVGQKENVQLILDF